MRSRFREWYAPTPAELKRLWQEGTVVLDANVLLGLYQYPPDTLNEFFSVLDRLKERVWLPHQVGLEYHRGRDKSLPQQRAVLEKLIRSIEGMSGGLDTLGLPEYHPVLNFAEVESDRIKVKEALENLLEGVRGALGKTPAFTPESVLQTDPLRDRITSLFEGRVGEAFSTVELQQIHKEGAERYAQEIPPGYKDRSKEGPARYGDLIIWKQLLKARKNSPEGCRGTILVTNDRKEDWWVRKDERLLGPRPELVREYLDCVGDDFFVYTPVSFLRSAPEHLSLAISADAIAEVRRISLSSPVTLVLRQQRMVLPPPAVRTHALAQIYDSAVSGQLKVTGDLNRVIDALGEPLAHNYVATPLFFSLISESYGPLTVDRDASTRLRDRTIHLPESSASKEAFITHAHAAWLAQGLFRMRNEEFTDEDLLLAFFGDNYGDEASSLLRQAKQFAALEGAYRGRTPQG